LSKKKKIKSRRKFSRDEFFTKRDELSILMKNHMIRQTFPDKKEREAYIQALLDGLKMEPDLELKDD
jgi:hypothetical protein